MGPPMPPVDARPTLQLDASRASSACRPANPRAGYPARPDPGGSRRRARSRGAAALRGARRSAARSPRPATGGAASSARRMPMKPSTRSKWSKASRMTATSPVPTSPASMAAFRPRTRSNSTPSAARRVHVGQQRARRTRSRAAATRSAIAGCAPAAVTRVEPRQEVHQPLERFVALRQRRHRELQLLAVVHREQQVAQRRRRGGPARAGPGR